MPFNTNHITTNLGKENLSTTLIYTRHSNNSTIFITQSDRIGTVFNNGETILGGHNMIANVYASAFVDLLGECIVCCSVKDQSPELLKETLDIVRGWKEDKEYTKINILDR
jgi:hypothetical protein